MRNLFLLTITIVLGTLQNGYSQSNCCAPNTKEVKNALYKYFETEEQLKSLEQLYGIDVVDNPKDEIRVLTDENDKAICTALKSNLEWLSEYESYSFFTLNDFYFIVLYTFDEKNDFNLIEIPIINKEYEAVGSFLNID